MTQSILTKSQTKTMTGTNNRGDTVKVKIRYDDSCGNGHNSFAITAEVYHGCRLESCGCCHDDVAEAFPDLVKYLKWHLCSSDGPMHYVANTVYHASNRDHNGLLEGEEKQIINGISKLPIWKVIARNGAGDIVEVRGIAWANSENKPDRDGSLEWVPVTRVGEGKERDFAAARSTAIWPDATDEQLSSDPVELKRMLLDRLPGLLVEFQQDVESLGFTF